MNSILDLPEVRPRAVPLSVVAYERMTSTGLMEQQTELLHGIVVKKMSKSPLHAQIADRFFKLIFLAVGEAVWVRSEAPVVLMQSVPEPDISVVAGQDSDYLEQHPRGARLVVEIAVNSGALDREMAADYAAGGVQEYWLGCWRSRAQWNGIPIRWGDAIRRCGRWSPGWWLRWFCRRWQLIWKGCFRGVGNGLWDLEFSGLEARRPHRLEACVTRRKLGVFYGFQASG